MSGKASRDKGYRGEREIVKILGGTAERTGYAGTDNPDVTTDFGRYSVKNTKTPLSLKKVLAELIILESKDPKRHHFVALKVEHKYLIVERIEQHVGDHGGGIK